MRALSACLTAVLGLGLAAMAACSSTASDTAAGGTGGTSSGGTSTGGTAGGIGAGGDLGAAGETGTGCAFIDACAPCANDKCAAEVAACTQTDDVCDMAFAASSTGDSLVVCACDPTKTPADCAATFSAVDAKAKAVVDCAALNCKTECGL
jgi:hypothetical protein